MGLKVLMVGTSPQGKGGIATVVSVLQQSGFFERYGARYIVTHAEGSALAKLRAALASAWQVLTVCLRERPQVVHVHAASRASFFRKSVLLAIARSCGCGTVFHLHGAEFKQFAEHESGPLARWWIRHTLRQSSAVITLSESWATFLHGYAPGVRVRVVANSVRVPALAPAALEEPARILFLGRADRRKGIFELLQALALLRPAFPAVRLAIGGDGDLAEVRRAAQQCGVADIVEVLGWIDAGQRAAQLARASVFCLPSYDEGLPMAMLECMAAGKAVVVTPVGGIPEAIIDRDNGILVPPGDADGLAAGLGLLFQDSTLRQHVAAQARATIEQRFSTAVVMDQLGAVYAEVAARP